MKLIRLRAVYTENSAEFIILNLLIDQENKIVRKNEMFGYVMDADDDGLYKYLFTIINKKDLLILEYGADSEYATDKVNLPQKEIKIGEYFTRWVNSVNGTNEYVYEISNIEEII